MIRFVLYIVIFCLPYFVFAQETKSKLQDLDTTKIMMVQEVRGNLSESSIDSLHQNLQSKLSAKIDTLQSLQSPDTVLLKQLRSLSSQLDSLKKPGLSTDSIKLNQRLVALQEKANG